MEAASEESCQDSGDANRVLQGRFKGVIELGSIGTGFQEAGPQSV